MTLHVKDAGVWKSVVQPYVKDGGTWKPIQQLYVRDGGTWKIVFQSGPSFTPVPGGSYSDAGAGHAEFTVTASTAVNWTWSSTPLTVISNRTQGQSATSITFSLNAGAADKNTTVTLTATSGGVTYNWTIHLEAIGDGGGATMTL